jgi:opacity protein-like surface antigen
VQYGGWYIRGDLDYHWSKFRGGDYIRYQSGGVPGTFDFGKLKGALSLGGGVGYQINNHFRTDLTVDWMSKSKFRGQTTGECAGVPCSSIDRTSYTALLLLANAYVDIGTWHGVTPYVGAGIGGAWLKWDTLHNRDDNGDTYHKGGKGWRFAYALAAGASYCLTRNVDLDVGYRYSHINGGKMFGYANNGGPGFDKGLDVHEVRGGLRYNFGGSSKCAEPETVVYAPEPIYTK